MKKNKKMIETAMGMAVLMALSGGCAPVSQSEEQSKIDYGSIDTDTQMVEAQDETNIDVGDVQNRDVQNTAVFIDEKLDENLFISAELKMPESDLYEYATQLKSFDYDKVQEAIGQNMEGTLVVDDGSDEFTGGSLTYQRNDMASHLDTYCSYAGEMGLTDDRDLSFMAREDAVAWMQNFIEMLGVGGELEALNVVAMDQADLENVKKAIMEDGDYQFLSAKGYGSDTFDEGVEVYRIIFRMNVNGIPVYRNEPGLRGTSERFLAYPVVITALLSNNGIEMITMMGMFEPYDGYQKEAAIIGEEGIKEAVLKKFGDVILSSEFRAKNIWMEYFPLLREGSFTEIDLIPVWCVDFEIDGESIEDSGYTIRFNAVTGEEIS
ncbi:MAG: hypothetical protein K2N80_16370 [Lachnospiraceae bacterium]|nr:hypothetical protein [Lachnospiraceae bacterium]